LKAALRTAFKIFLGFKLAQSAVKSDIDLGDLTQEA
jgi:hypothetical protein